MDLRHSGVGKEYWTVCVTADGFGDASTKDRMTIMEATVFRAYGWCWLFSVQIVEYNEIKADSSPCCF